MNGPRLRKAAPQSREGDAMAKEEWGKGGGQGENGTLLRSMLLRKIIPISLATVAFTFVVVTVLRATTQVESPFPTLGAGVLPRRGGSAKVVGDESSFAIRDVVAQYGREARKLLADGLTVPCDEASCAFDDVVVSLPLHTPTVLSKGDGKGQERKAMINPNGIFRNADDNSGGAFSFLRLRRRASATKKCTVYGMGINIDSTYEQQMSAYCDTHAFDCTVPKDADAVRDMPFTFHQTCIGEKPTNIGDTEGFGGKEKITWAIEFKSLRQVMKDLGHEKLDVLKFDIEGSEWDLIKTQFLDHKEDGKDGHERHPLPLQVQFELHTQWANPFWVPPDAVAGKGKAEVNRLFLELLDIGYYVISKEINNGDPACAEFSLYRAA